MKNYAKTKNRRGNFYVIVRRKNYMSKCFKIFWATGYSVIALPLVAGAMAFKGILLQPALAAILMSLSASIVAINAILLKKRHLVI